MATTVEYDVREVRWMLSRLPEELRDKASVMAINKTVAKARTEMKRQVTAVYNVKAGEVLSALQTTKASVSQNVVEGTLYPHMLNGSRLGRAMNIVRFLESKVSLAQAKKRGRANALYGIGSGGQLLSILYFKVKKGSPAKSVAAEGAKSAPFLGNNGKTVFRRTSNKRTPIEPVQVIDLPQMFNTAKINQAVLRKAAADLLVETQRAVDEMLRRMNT